MRNVSNFLIVEHLWNIKWSKSQVWYWVWYLHCTHSAKVSILMTAKYSILMDFCQKKKYCHQKKITFDTVEKYFSLYIANAWHANKFRVIRERIFKNFLLSTKFASQGAIHKQRGQTLGYIWPTSYLREDIH